jgi:hypothetical protein
MPFTCYSYPADMPPGGANKGPVRAARRGLREMPHSCYSYPLICFSYPDVASHVIQDRAAAPAAPPGLRRMPNTTCFRY